MNLARQEQATSDRMPRAAKVANSLKCDAAFRPDDERNLAGLAGLAGANRSSERGVPVHGASSCFTEANPLSNREMHFPTALDPVGAAALVPLHQQLRERVLPASY